MDELRHKLSKEGHESVDAHLSGGSLRKSLLKLLKSKG
ncbi:hypothetical protein ACUXST_001398 [Sphingomonas sp. F9_3S_D5_B_2]